MQGRHHAIYKATMTPSIPAIPATAAPKASGRAIAPPVLVEAPLEVVRVPVPVVEGAVVIVDATVVVWPLELVVVNWLTQVEARLAASEPIDSAADLMEEPAVSAADAMEAASLVMELTAAAPPVEAAFAREVAAPTTSEPMDWPPEAAAEATLSAAETIEFTSMFWGSARAALARKRAEVRMVNFIVIEYVLGCGDI
jgi:hypothetical protein